MANSEVKKKINIKESLRSFRESGKNLDPSVSLEQQKNVTAIEYVSICLARIGSVLVSTLSGLAATFAYEVYYGSINVGSEEIARINAVQTTITTLLTYAVGLLAAVVAYKWKSKWGRYRQWYVICLVPVFVLTVLNYFVPTGMDKEGMIAFKYILAILSTFFSAFNNLGLNIPQVISPNFKEKKIVATAWQMFYYLGYGGAYLYTFVFGAFSENKRAMYMSLAVAAGIITMVGNVMCAVFCRERIELPKQEKVKLSGALFSLFKYKNYRAYYYMQWVNVLAMLGKMSTYLAAITVGSSKNLLLTLPTAIGTVVGNVICAKISKKKEPTKILKFCGAYSMVCAAIIFVVAYMQKEFGLFFYIFYFCFGIGVGMQELSTSHFTVEFNDYLEWETGERLEAIHGTIPTYITNVLNYFKELLIPFMLAWVGYESSNVDNLVETMKAKPDYWDTCMWLLAFLVFGYALCNLFKAIILKFFYDVEGDKKIRMYEELEQKRRERHEENLAVNASAVETVNKQ
ncbi:MAG: MFS transporter [Clostridiales bacterium]|nr:MFS transporter [Clostridiales bacterium]